MLTPQTRLIVLTAPHNPSGVRTDRETLSEIGSAADRVGAHVLVDEVYLDAANLVNPTASAVSATRLDGPFVVINSLTKSYGLAGLRCGWAIASPQTTERIRRVRDLVDNIGAAPADRLSAFAFSHIDRLAARARNILSPNLALARKFFDAHPQLTVASAPESSVTFPRLNGVDAARFIDRLLDEHGVAVAPGSFFDAPNHVRISLAGRTDTLAEGLDRLGRALDALQ
jgi:aspartate/methionine/tyrosine aminotransferase